MRARWLVCLVLAGFVFSAAVPAAAGQGDKIVRTKAGLDGLKVINSVCRLLGCTVLGSLDTVPGQSGPSSLFLVRGLVDTVVTLLLSLLGIASIEADLPVAVAQSPGPYASDQASAAVLNQLYRQTPLSYYGSVVWEGYLDQPASEIVRVREAHCALAATGAGTVAVIDTGVDPGHPALAPVLTDGYDFTRDVAGGDETNDVGQASAAVLNGIYDVNASTVAVLDQASAAVLNDPDHVAFGHGTMVAGIVRLTAPTAGIMPLKAFSDDGSGYTSTIIRAVNYAVAKGAKVLNMSFSRPTSSAELKRALDNARNKGVIAVASAGNDGRATLVYPAAYDYVIGVASTSDDDVRSDFSNYGSRLVWVAAPGEGVITTYPWGSYAATWGTSFSTPFVAGATALLVGMRSTASPSQAEWAVAHAKPLTSELGNGRLDLYETVLAGRALWSTITASAVPSSCQTSAVDWTDAP